MVKREGMENLLLRYYEGETTEDETALVEALEAGKVKKYVTDFANPTVAGAKNTLVTPHHGRIHSRSPRTTVHAWQSKN